MPKPIVLPFPQPRVQAQLHTSQTAIELPVGKAA
jgi:hypothetical protein